MHSNSITTTLEHMTDPLWLQIPAANKATELEEKTQFNLKTISTVIYLADHGMHVNDAHININTLLAQTKTNFEIINLGSKYKLKENHPVINLKLGYGTADFCQQAAMTNEQLSKIINIGRQVAQRKKLDNAELFIAKEIGLGSTISAIAILSTILDIPANELINSHSKFIKNDVDHAHKLVQSALEYHKEHLGSSVLQALRRLGSFEIAALTGSYISCTHTGLPVVINDFVNAVAALITIRINPKAKHWFAFPQNNKYPIHRKILNEFDLQSKHHGFFIKQH